MASTSVRVRDGRVRFPEMPTMRRRDMRRFLGSKLSGNDQTCSRILACSRAASASPMPRRGRGRSMPRSSATTPIAEHDDAIGERHRLGHVVGDEHGGEAMLAPDAREQLVHLGAGQRIERAERLVEEQHARAADQRARQRDALLLAAGEDRRPVVGAVGEADIGERRLRRLAPAAARARCRHCRSPAATAAGANPGRAAGPSAAARRPARRRRALRPASACRGRRSAAAASSCRRRSGRRRRGTVRPESRDRAICSTCRAPKLFDTPSSATACPSLVAERDAGDGLALRARGASAGTVSSRR